MTIRHAIGISSAIALAGSAHAQVNIPDKPAPTEHVAAADIGGDGLFDFAHTEHATDDVEIWEGVGPDAVQLAGVIPLDDAAGVALGDVDGDGFVDLVVGSTGDQTIRIGYGDGAFTFLFDAPINVGIDPHTIVITDACDDFMPEILVANESRSAQRVVLDPMTAPLVLTPTDFADPAYECPEQVSNGPCNNYTEPNCNPTATIPGIQECMRAALCRSEKCHWAACIECYDGNGCHWWERPEWVGANLACAAVTDAELVGCLTEALPI